MKEVLFNRIEVSIPILILLSVCIIFYDSVFFYIGASDNNFDIYLEILNGDYKRYREIGKELYKEASNEIGLNFGWEEFVENL